MRLGLIFGLREIARLLSAVLCRDGDRLFLAGGGPLRCCGEGRRLLLFYFLCDNFRVRVLREMPHSCGVRVRKHRKNSVLFLVERRSAIVEVLNWKTIRYKIPH